MIFDELWIWVKKNSTIFLVLQFRPEIIWICVQIFFLLQFRPEILLRTTLEGHKHTWGARVISSFCNCHLYCHWLCHFYCHWYCHLYCHWFCHLYCHRYCHWRCQLMGEPVNCLLVCQSFIDNHHHFRFNRYHYHHRYDYQIDDINMSSMANHVHHVEHRYVYFEEAPKTSSYAGASFTGKVNDNLGITSVNN